MKSNRRYDLDWIRVIVFDLLILYHIGMFFVSWDWLLKNNVIIEWIQWPMIFLNRWRLPILFVISGMGTKYALSRRNSGQFAKERVKRLLIPLIAGILLVVAPQIYFVALERGYSFSSYWDYYGKFLAHVYADGHLDLIGLWSHLWFLPYLLIMSLISIPLFLYLRKEDNPFIVRLRGLIQSYPTALYVFLIPFLLVDYLLKPFFPMTLNLIDDWYFFSLYYICFLSGFVLICIGDAFWKAVKQIKEIAIIFGCISFFIMLDIVYTFPSYQEQFFETLNRWSWILAIFGYAATYLNQESKILAYRNQAVYPFYILHQTFTVIIAYYLIDSGLPSVDKFTVLLIGTYGGCFLFYEYLIKRFNLLRFLFGVKPIQKMSQAQEMEQKVSA